MVPTIDSVCRAYIAQVKNYRKPSTGRATRTWRTVQSDLKHLREMAAPPEAGCLFADGSRTMNDMPATSLTPDVLAELLVQMAAPGRIRRNTINRTRATIIRMFNWARKPERTWCRTDANRTAIKNVWRELRDVEPLTRGRTPAKESIRVVAADHVDVWQTIQEADHEAMEGASGGGGDRRMADLRDLIRVMWESGMRPNEAVQLSLSSIDFTREPWAFTPIEHKTEHHGKRRVIYLGRNTRRALNQRIAMVKAEGRDWLFEQRTRGGRYTGKPARVHYMGQLLSALHARHSIPHFALNQLRHAAATRIARSQDIHAASSVLGHSSIKTTEIYIDPDDEGLRRTAEEHC